MSERERSMSQTEPLWTPSQERKAGANLAAFSAYLVKAGLSGSLETYKDLHRFSIDHPEKFWGAMWDFGKVKASRRGDVVLADKDKMPGARFFPDARLNYAENLLRKSDDTPALIFRGEDKVRKVMSWRQ